MNAFETVVYSPCGTTSFLFLLFYIAFPLDMFEGLFNQDNKKMATSFKLMGLQIPKGC